MQEENLLEFLNEEQTEAVTHTDGPLMIIAGAGTGKTTVVTQRIAWLIEQKHAEPENILALTFTEKAAEEMEERVDMLLPYGYVDLQISTFHAFCEYLLRQYGAEIGLSRDFKLVNELDAWLLARQDFDRFDLDYYQPLGNPTKYIKSLLKHFSRLKDEGVMPDDYLEFVEGKKVNLDTKTADEDATTEIARLEELANAYHTYQRILLDNDAIDFGGLLLYVLKLLQERPNVKKKIRERFTHVLVDEFQDTNFAQYEIVKEIAAPKNNLTVVGDDDQSIYKFRGASLSNILQFQNDYPDTKKVVLTKNYRSVQSILDRAYEFIQMNNPNRLESKDEDLEKQLESQKDGHGIVEHIHCATSEEETERVAQRIAQLKKEHPDVSWNDFAILARSNNSASTFLSALERHNIPYHFVAMQGLYTKPIILDMLAYLRVVDTPHDSPSMYRIISQEMHHIPTGDIAELTHYANKKAIPLYKAAEQASRIKPLSEETVSTLDTIVSKIQNVRKEAVRRKSSELFLLVAKKMDVIDHINNLPEQQKQDDFRYLQQFYERLKRFDKQHDDPILKNFLKVFDEERNAGEEGSLSTDLDAGPEMVKVMTVHGSKGLEFKFVFLVHLVNRRFPTVKRGDPIPLPEGIIKEELTEGDWHLEEERRLFYVGVTRAKKGVFFTSADDYGGSRTKKLSRFLKELGYAKSEEEESDSLTAGEKLERQNVEEGEPEHPDEIVYQLPKRFSFTQLTAFRTCPLQYKYAHVLNIPVFGKWTLSFGKTMHNTLHEFFLRWMERTGQDQGTLFDADANAVDVDEPPVDFEEMMEIYKENWMDDWFINDEQREKYRKQGRQSLKLYYDEIAEVPPSPLYLEQGFTLKFGEVVLKGRIDRIDTFEDGVEIIDYKTGKPKTAKKLRKKHKEQLYLYQMATRDVLDLKPKKLTYHYLQDNSRVSFLGDDDQLLDLEEEIQERVSQIKDSNFDATPGYHCKFCDFKDICDYSQA